MSIVPWVLVALAGGLIGGWLVWPVAFNRGRTSVFSQASHIQLRAARRGLNVCTECNFAHPVGKPPRHAPDCSLGVTHED